MSDTPRTDVAIVMVPVAELPSGEIVKHPMTPAWVTREIERENARLREFVACISKQKPEKPDHWCSCSQCERNIGEAQDLLASPETKQRAG